MTIDPEILSRLQQLEQKYAVMGQDMKSYLEGLLYADFLTYWDYIQLDVLLNLQKPKTSFPDEEIFIVYHQITELYFKLTISALRQITDADTMTAAEMLKYITRVNDYFSHLINSYEIMVEGMDKEQFLKFRMSLLPASGFQSAQYRIIEIMSTDAHNLIHVGVRDNLPADSGDEEVYNNFYWKMGGKELATGKKTLTLRQFEKKYSESFLRMIADYRHVNVWQRYLSLPESDREDPALIEALREMDLNIEVRWPLMHYRSAVRYLQKDPEDIAATGGTNWQKYLPPRYQRVNLFPRLFNETELAEWGKWMVASV